MPLNITCNHSHHLMPLSCVILHYGTASRVIIFYADLKELRTLLLSDPCPRYGCDGEKCFSILFSLYMNSLNRSSNTVIVFKSETCSCCSLCFPHFCNFLSSGRETQVCSIGGWQSDSLSLRSSNTIDPQGIWWWHQNHNFSAVRWSKTIIIIITGFIMN